MENKFYKSYLHTRYWRDRSKALKYEKHFICEMCGNHLLLEVTEIIRNRNHPSWHIPEVVRFVDMVIECKGDKDKLIQVHHLSYKNTGHEPDKDLACVCKPCHVLITENTKDRNLSKAWEVTQIRLKEILQQIHNNPDGEQEFAAFIPYEEIKMDLNEELEEAQEDYYDFVKDVFDTEEEFN